MPWIERSCHEEKQLLAQLQGPGLAGRRLSRINESVFCESFILTHQIVFSNGFFFTEDGRVTDEMPLRSIIYAELRDYASNNVAPQGGLPSWTC